MPLSTNRTNATVSTDTHPADHNDVNTAVNGLVTANWTLISGPSAESSVYSTTEVDAITVSGLSIATTTEVLITGVGRTVASSADPAIGLKINSTITRVADASLGTQTVANASFCFEIWLPSRETSYLHGGWIAGIAGSSGVGGTFYDVAKTAAIPNATITSLAIRAKNSGAGGNGFIKNVRVYTR